MVQQVAKDMGYIPNSLASSMRSGRTDSIAIILGEMVNPYNAYLMNHLTTHLHDRGYTTLMFVTNQRRSTRNGRCRPRSAKMWTPLSAPPSLGRTTWS